jgi:uncharacterized repeat protein (TIGR03837 family)
MASKRSWDIFCRIVDNYGDAGVCWRLARILATEHARSVTLWLNDPFALARIATEVDPSREEQHTSGVTIRHWVTPFAFAATADVVIEAFGCGLPDTYVAAMANQPVAPVWFILEYLSAEPWVETVHGQASPHPRLPLARRFWFPGFTVRTGGLLRERELLAQRDAFLRRTDAQNALWSALRTPPPAADEIRVSLFCYPNVSLHALLDAWAEGQSPVSCLVPKGVVRDSLDRWTGGHVSDVGEALARGRLTLRMIPFVDQDDYDRLLWLCDINFVRGEDSFVRAQWAGRPFVWHIYPQAESAHWVKLDAFLDRFEAGMSNTSMSAVRRFWHAWNGATDAPAMAEAWRDLAALRYAIGEHAQSWASRLASLPELADGLVTAADCSV